MKDSSFVKKKFKKPDEFLKPKNFEERFLFFSKRFLNFIKNYRKLNGKTTYYSTFLKNNLRKNKKSLMIDLSDVSEFDIFLFFEIINSPAEMILIFDFALNGLVKKIFYENKIINQIKFRVRFSNSIDSEIRHIYTIEKEDFNKLVTIKGLLVKRSKIFPSLVSGFFRCEICWLETYSFPKNGNLQEPIYCFNCKNFNCFRLLFQRCNFSDTQYLLVEGLENPYKYRNTPPTLTLIVREEFVNIVEEGEFICGTGVLRVLPFGDHKKKINFSLVKPILDVLHIEKKKNKIEKIFNFSKEKIFNEENLQNLREKKQFRKKLHCLGQNKNIFKLLRNSCLPDILGVEVLKSGLICQLCQSLEKSSGNLNYLFIVENYPLQSLILKKSSKLNPRGWYTNTKNLDLKKLFFQFDKKKGKNPTKIFPGLMLKRRISLFCIDDIQDLPRYFFPVLKEGMNNQMVSFVKSGIFTSLPLEFSLICSLVKNEENRKNKNTDLFCNLPLSFVKSFDEIFFIKGTDSRSIDKNFAEQTMEAILSLEKRKMKKNPISKIMGFSSKSLIWFLEETVNMESSSDSKILLKENIKWKNILEKIEIRNPYNFFKKKRSMISLLKLISRLFANQRLSRVIGNEDLRNGIVQILEASKSLEFFLQSNKSKTEKKENV